MSAPASYDLVTRTTRTDVAVSNVILPSGTRMGVTHVTIQFGSNNATVHKLVNLWTHEVVMVRNDLITLGAEVKTVFKHRATRNISSGTLSVEAFVKHELSPDARCKTRHLTNLPELVQELTASLHGGEDALLAISKTTGLPYQQARTDVVFARQSADFFMDDSDVQALLALHAAKAPAGSRLLLVLVVDGENAMYDHAVRLAAARPDAVLAAVDRGGLSLVGLALWLQRCDTDVFASCELPKQNLRLVVRHGPAAMPHGPAADVLCAYIGPGMQGDLGSVATPLAVKALPAAAAAMFVQHEFLLVYPMIDAATAMTVEFLYTEDHSLEGTRVAATGDGWADVALADVSPPWAKWAARALNTWALAAMPKEAHLVAPWRAARAQLVLLRQQAATVGACACEQATIDALATVEAVMADALAAQGFTQATRGRLAALHATLLPYPGYAAAVANIANYGDCLPGDRSRLAPVSSLYHVYAPAMYAGPGLAMHAMPPVALGRNVSSAAKYDGGLTAASAASPVLGPFP